MIENMKWWNRLEQRISELGWSKAELARRSGITYDSINKYMRGDIDNPRGNVMAKLAQTIDKPLLWLRDGIEMDTLSEVLTPVSISTVRVAGTVEAGTFREVDEFDQSENVEIAVPKDERFPHARQIAFNVSGDSMNDLKPRPILPGDRAICVAYEDVADDATLRDGMVVVVERTRDGGHTREWSIKQVELYEDRTVFAPRSTNPKHKPIVIKRDIEADDGTRVEIIGLVRRVINDLPF